MRVRALVVCLLLLLLLLLLCGAAMAAGTVSFNLKSYPTVPLLESGRIVIADFNRDGIPDVAYTVLYYPGEVVVKMGTGGGNLGPDVYYPMSAPAADDPVAVDINGDGWLDIMVRNTVIDAFSSNVTQLLPLINNGDGTFHEGSSIPLPGYPGSFAVGDFNHDGKIDLAVIVCDNPNAGYPSGFATCSLNTYLGDGSGGFGQKQSVQLAGASYDLHAADINGDGKLDLVNVRGSVGLIWWGRGDGTFSAPTYLRPPTTNPVDSVAVADFNNDGRLDLALLSGKPCHPSCGAGSANTVWMFKNNGGTSFTLTTHAPFAAHAGNIVAGDLNGDLNLDLVYYNANANPQPPQLSGSSWDLVYALGLGNDTLGPQGTLQSSNGGLNYYISLAFRVLDGDSRADYAVIDWNEGLLDIGIQTGGWKNCAPPNSAKVAARICGVSNGATVTSPLLVKASGNSPAGVNQLQVWIDGKQQYVKWGDQLAKKFTLSSGKHRIAVVANDKYIGNATTAVTVTVP